MPEGDTIFRAASTLHRALAGSVVTRFDTVLGHLARVHEDTPLTGRTVEAVESRGKWLLMRFSGDLVLLTHLRMSGSWHIYRPGERWQRPRSDMRIVVGTETFDAVAFRVPVAEMHDAASAERRLTGRVGPDLLGEEVDVAAVVARLRAAGDLPIGEALLRQDLLAGIGNVYRSEVCFASRVPPQAAVGRVEDDELRTLVETARRYLTANVANGTAAMVTYTGLRRTTGRSDPRARLWVYGRAGQPCRRCGTTLAGGRDHGGRVVFWCPECQPAR